MKAEFRRDATATAAIFGFFAASWFGWAQENPPTAWQTALIVGSILALLVAVVGGVLTWRRWSSKTVFNRHTSRRFGLIVGLEFAIAGVGAGVLTALGRADLIPAWIALVVGVHFFPLASLLKDPLLYGVAALVSLIALVAVPLAATLAVPVSAFTGFATGIVLLGAALFSLSSAVA